jgi:hypothetical protein
MTGKALRNVGILVTGLVAVVSDVLAPVGPFALPVAVLAGALAIFLVLPIPWIGSLGRRLFKSYWRVPVVATLALSAALLFGAHVLTQSAPSDGWIGSHVSALGDVQQSLGLVEEQTQAISETTSDIKKDTEEIKDKLDDVKQETSDDPRKELANLGVTWSQQSFVDALMAGDERTVRLFLEGGMSPAVSHSGASAVLYMLQTQLPDPKPMLELMAEAGFDFDTNLHDGRVLPHYSDSFPPFFESELLPDGYISAGKFDGPMLLWLVIRSSSGITEEWDLSTIAYLKSKGVDLKVTLQFLEALEYAWGDFPAYQQVRATVLG